MSVKKKIATVLLVAAILLLNIGIIFREEERIDLVNMNFAVAAEQNVNITIFYATGDGFREEQKIIVPYTEAGTYQSMLVQIPSNTDSIRMDFDGDAHLFSVSLISFTYMDKSQPVSSEKMAWENLLFTNEIDHYQIMNDTMYFTAGDNDPHIAIEVGPTEIAEELSNELYRTILAKNIAVAVILDIMCIIACFFRKKVFGLPIELYHNRALIMNLARNDFKTRFAGSYLGIVWAFIQPIVTVLVYWFVFQVGLRSGNVQNYPFVLWLVAGLVPWFFFQEALNGGTNALIEYSYLVKKVVFKISTLPLVKVISALFIHAFFILFALILYACYGYYPDLYTLQIIYYSLALFIFTLAICYTTSAIVIFFRDLSQIINIILQVGVWVTPIMWNIDDMAQRIPRLLVLILKANPLYYIVNGYRDALLHKVWFWERFDLTCLFWIVTAFVFAIGTVIFKRLKVHFADVL